MEVQQVADRLVELCRNGQWETAQSELFDNKAVSIEPVGAPMERVEGLEAIAEKGKQFSEMVESFHSVEVSDPLVADKFITLSMKIDCTMKEMGHQVMEELCLYEVENDKIVREQFYYTPQPPPQN